MTESGAQLARRLVRRWAVVEVAANVLGALIVFAFLHALHSAENPGHSAHAASRGILQLSVYLAIAVPAASLWRARRTRPLWRWLSQDRPPRPDERDLVMREPLRELVVPAVMWGCAALLFGPLGLSESTRMGLEATFTITLGGITTCALIYLIVQRLLRPVTARALATAPPERPVGPGISTRLIMVWALASGVPLLGLGVIAAEALGGHFGDAQSLAFPMLVLAGGGLGVGALATALAARALADPLGAVRLALSRVRAGDLDAVVAIDDGGEIGLLEAGFNEMADGLRERERIRDLFGRHVGREVASKALARDVALGGETREVAVVFVDLVGSTALASRLPPSAVVSLLNRFFSVVVAVTEAHGGWVNKFEGDAALCVFGAPTDDPKASNRALAAARALDARIRDELPEIGVGVGVSAGPALAGNVGAETRLEYTVIGDPINEAARLCERAKREPARVLASASALARADQAERDRWRLGEEVVLRGRSGATRVASPTVGAGTRTRPQLAQSG